MIFDKIYVISLQSQKNRLDKFFSELPSPWLLGDIEVFNAINGYPCKLPNGWISGKGAWGCYQSHLSILKLCKNLDIDNVLILEDDAIFCENFNDKVQLFLDNLPDDWEMFYLGGQHLKMPKPEIINDTVGIGTNINRTHAYGLSKSGIEKLIEWLDIKNWKPKHHIDHHYGRFQEDGKIIPYCTLGWLVGQRDSFSTISRKNMSTRWWN